MRVCGRRVCRIPGATIKLVAATCIVSAQYFGSTVLFEPTESGLLDGLLASPALVWVILGNLCACGERFHSGCDASPYNCGG